jgi:hypothetical protein
MACPFFRSAIIQRIEWGFNILTQIGGVPRIGRIRSETR